MAKSLQEALEIAQKRSGISVNDLIRSEAGDESKEVHVAPQNKSAWKHGNDQIGKRVEWANDQFGTLNVTIKGFSIGDVTHEGINTYARIYTSGREPGKLTIGFEAQPQDGVVVFRAQHGQIMRGADNIEPLVVPIEWSDDNGGREDTTRPHTRKTGQDNLDIVFRRADGRAIQLQIGVVTRWNKFWVTVQQVNVGHYARTTMQKAATSNFKFHKVGSHACLVAPMATENAFPGGDYLRTFSVMGPKLLEMAVADGAIAPLSEVGVSEWTPDSSVTLSPGEQGDGYVLGWPYFFNLISGTGMVLCDDGKTCFVHFNKVRDKHGKQLKASDFPALQPMLPVKLLLTNNPKMGNRLEAKEAWKISA